jgi:hypothetical protein
MARTSAAALPLAGIAAVSASSAAQSIGFRPRAAVA